MSTFRFPLVDSSYDNAEILKCIEVLLSGQLTMGPRVAEFEREFATAIGAKHAVMVNSGSSANLLAVSAAMNPVRPHRLQWGDIVAVPAVCWSTSLWPLVQLGLKPVLVDVDSSTLNVSIPSLRHALATLPVRALMAVHVLGNSAPMEDLCAIVQEHDLILIEDTCESLGSTAGGRNLGTIGDFGTYSFYFSHHMTTIEGGMVVCGNDADWDLLKCLRAHGWSREQSNRLEIERCHEHIDPRFLFINSGFNLRPMEIQAAFGLEQLKRLDEMNLHRRKNTVSIRAAFESHVHWNNQITFPAAAPGNDPCWFGFPFLLPSADKKRYAAFVDALMSKGIDTRPIVSGNMAIQPAIALHGVDCQLGPFVGAQQVHDRGVFIGIHAKPLQADRIDWLVDTILEAADACFD